MLKALLIALWAGLCAIDDVGPQMLRRPLLIAPVVGAIMGDLQSGLLIGATLEIMWMGVGNVGAYSAPDMISGTCIGTALGIASGGTEIAVALAVPTSLLAQQLLILCRSGLVAVNPVVDRWAETGDFKKIFRINYIASAAHFLVRAVPTFIAVYLGADVIDTIVAALPANVMSGLSVASKLIPAVGIGLLMLMMVKKPELWLFLLAGFTLAVYLKLAILPITLLSLPLALIYDLAVQKKTAAGSTNDQMEGELDL